VTEKNATQARCRRIYPEKYPVHDIIFYFSPMELSLKADTLTLTSEKREILLNAQGLTLDALFIDTP